MARQLGQRSNEKVVVRPQPGPQEKFLSSVADVCVYGGSAGGGKSFALLLDPLRYKDNPQFGGVIFRRTYPEITREGGLWDESIKLYPLFGAKPKIGTLTWEFPSGMTISFSHLQHDTDVNSWQGAQSPFFGFDEGTHFTASSFFYLLSRNRSNCGVKPYVRVTTNPDADSWLANFLAWWINQDTGFPIPERAGIIRYFYRSGSEVVWADTKEELYCHLPTDIPELMHMPKDTLIKSCTFIPAKVYDNKILLKANPEYLGNLLAQEPVERSRLLEGNWKVRHAGGNVFKEEWFLPAVDLHTVPRKGTKYIRAWDFAASEVKKVRGVGRNEDPDWTAGVLLAKTIDKCYYILDVRQMRGDPGKVARYVAETAAEDGRGVSIVIEQEPGSSGKFVSLDFLKLLDGYDFKAVKSTGDKTERARPAARQAEGGNMKMVRGRWNDMFKNNIGNTGVEGRHDDIGDALSLGYSRLADPVKRAGVISVTVGQGPVQRPKMRLSPFGNVWEEEGEHIIKPEPSQSAPLTIFDV